MIIYTPLIYWLTGLTPANNGAHYIMYIIVVFLCAVTFAMFTRLLATFFKTKEAASGFAGTHSNQKYQILGLFLALCSHCLYSQMWALINMLHLEMPISTEFTVTDSDAYRISSNWVVLHKGCNYFAGLCIIFFLLFSGFLIAKNKVPNWWVWVYYISPLQWAITAIVCNEFLSDRYSQVSGILELNSQSHSSRWKFFLDINMSKVTIKGIQDKLQLWI